MEIGRLGGVGLDVMLHVVLGQNPGEEHATAQPQLMADCNAKDPQLIHLSVCWMIVQFMEAGHNGLLGEAVVYPVVLVYREEIDTAQILVQDLEAYSVQEIQEMIVPVSSEHVPTGGGLLGLPGQRALLPVLGVYQNEEDIVTIQFHPSLVMTVLEMMKSKDCVIPSHVQVMRSLFLFDW